MGVANKSVRYEHAGVATIGHTAIAFVFVLTLVLMLLLSSCENTASDAPSQTGADSAASSPALEPSDIEGYWIVQWIGEYSLDEMLEKGMLYTLQFEGDNIFKITIRIKDATLEHEGSYRISDGKVFVSVPEMEEHFYEGLSLTFKTIEDGEVVFDGDTLTTTSISTNGSETIAKKCTDDQYRKYVDRVVALGPKKVTIGESVTTDTVTFVVNSLSYVDEIYPSDTSGYYSYYEHQEGKSYLLVNVTFSNNGTEYAVPGYATEATFNVAGNKYSGEIEVDAGARFGKHYSVEAKDTATLYIYCLVPDSVRDTGETQLTWSIPTDQTYMQTYYRTSYPHDDFVIAL